MRASRRRACAAAVLWSLCHLPALGAAPIDLTDGASFEAYVRTVRPFRVSADLSRLPESERRTLALLVEASRATDAIFLRQELGSNVELLGRLAADGSADGRRRLAWFLFERGPWIGDRVFVRGAPPRPPAGTFYPADSTRGEIESWLATLPAKERALALSRATVIRRRQDGGLAAVPYSMEYQEEITRLVELVGRAAASTTQPSLREFLQKQAAALRSNDYAEADAAYARLESSIIPAIGAWEGDEDGWYNAKASFQAMVMIRDDARSARLAGIASRLQALEDRLPVRSDLRGRKLGASRAPLVVDLVHAAGLAAQGTLLAGLSLPDDPEVIARAGTLAVMIRNAVQAQYETGHRLVIERTFAAAYRNVSLDDVLLEIGLVRLMDGLGPHTVLGTGRPVPEALGDQAAVATQLQSMLLSLWSHEELMADGTLDRSGAPALYPAFAVAALRRSVVTPRSAQARASTAIFHRILDAGGIRVDGAGRLEFDAEKASASVRAQIAEVLEATGTGDGPRLRSWMEAASKERPALAPVRQKISDLPIGVFPTYPTADAASPP